MLEEKGGREVRGVASTQEWGGGRDGRRKVYGGSERPIRISWKGSESDHGKKGKGGTGGDMGRKRGERWREGGGGRLLSGGLFPRCIRLS